MSENDRELLELAAKAAGIRLEWVRNSGGFYYENRETGREIFDPLTDDGDALRLAVKCRLLVDCASHCARPLDDGIGWRDADDVDANAATRRAIVRAAAGIGRAL